MFDTKTDKPRPDVLKQHFILDGRIEKMAALCPIKKDAAPLRQEKTKKKKGEGRKKGRRQTKNERKKRRNVLDRAEQRGSIGLNRLSLHPVVAGQLPGSRTRLGLHSQQ